jgi:hypothetical protein
MYGLYHGPRFWLMACLFSLSVHLLFDAIENFGRLFEVPSCYFYGRVPVGNTGYIYMRYSRNGPSFLGPSIDVSVTCSAAALGVGR